MKSRPLVPISFDAGAGNVFGKGLFAPEKVWVVIGTSITSSAASRKSYDCVHKICMNEACVSNE